ncbi:ABC transporter ATP-binding protein [Leucobacter massiliensis]|uniref:ABC transporter ATP-binding protein n=1 Tax=Leucobacter massiliensis TaxID=1686285 RepID=A0A2S9QS73_9MICO|nr:ABC transporter ATP-binding protein [Leucobacter massiliensis]PRI12440.1 ABC transporter ATP-binding protein [Leucobacter massiliensis]
MTAAIETRGLTRRYRGAAALEDVTLDIQPNVITGLLGRNGAGKTTLMSLITAQDRPSSGSVRVNGRDPFERAGVIEQMCFIRDNQRYPDDYRLRHAMRAAAICFPNWSSETAERLAELFRIPAKTEVKKFSRGQLSALGIVLGLASRAPITFFDEPYLGLDATARTVFYDELLRDYAEQPRTVILSTHLIDEMDRLLERVVILERGRVVTHAEVEDLRGAAFQLAGRATAVEDFVRGREVLTRRSIGGLATAVVAGRLGEEDRASAAAQGLELSHVSLQELVAAYGLGEPSGAGKAATPNGEGPAAAAEPEATAPASAPTARSAS